MDSITCPHCYKPILMTVVGAPEPAHRAAVVGPVTAAVDEFVRLNNGHHLTFPELRAMYDKQAPRRRWPTDVTNKALGQALRLAGASPWRTKTERGWDLPRG